MEGGSDLEPSNLHGEDMGRDTQIRDAVRNEGGVDPNLMREVVGKLMSSAQSDVLTESVSEDSSDENQVLRKLPVRRAKKGLKRLKGKNSNQNSESESSEVEGERSSGLVGKGSSSK